MYVAVGVWVHIRVKTLSKLEVRTPGDFRRGVRGYAEDLLVAQQIYLCIPIENSCALARVHLIQILQEVARCLEVI